MTVSTVRPGIERLVSLEGAAEASGAKAAGKQMRWSFNRERSSTVAAWLFCVAALVFAMVVVGGATRLTGSGLSITEWDPIMGILPPLTQKGWAEAFARYQHIPQYVLVNRGMTLDQFKFIYAWEWTHRLLGRFVGLIFFAPMAFFVLTKRLPRRLTLRCWLLLALGALQGLVGWWMVSSGLTKRILVAPEWLAAHLGLALFIYSFAVWTGMEAWAGRVQRSEVFLTPVWRRWAAALVLFIFVQILMGALVAGNQAGLIYNDWPLMNGRWFPSGYVHGGLFSTLLHSQAAVQFNHRIGAYILFLLVIGFAAACLSAPAVGRPVKTGSVLLAGGVTLQAVLGVLTLRYGAPLPLSLAHQALAVIVLTLALSLAWRIRRN